MSRIEYDYARQSAVTDPGAMAGEIAGLAGALGPGGPGDDLAETRRLVSGLVTHYRDPGFAGYGIPEERRAEIDTRYAAAMLARLRELDARPLGAERSMDRRLVGCCRDFTVLTLTLLRAAGVPARARVGFAGYFAPGWWIDHVVAEVWDAAEDRWRLMDANLGTDWPDHWRRDDGDAPFDVADVPRDAFLTGPAAWRACRAGERDPERFVVAPELEIPYLRGWSYLRHNLVHDLATLAKREMLLWDTWGILTDDPSSPAELELLDRVAAATGVPDPTPEAIEALYAAEPALRVPPVVTSMNPLNGDERTVRVGEG